MYKVAKCKPLIVLLMIISFLLTANSYAYAEFDSQAESAILIETSTGKVLYEKNADIPMPPASITKVMTLLLGFEAIEEGMATWNDEVPISETAWRMGGSQMFLEVGHTVKYEDLIKGISIVSANDGCVALAEYLYGSESAFVQVMNRRAQELGLTNTYFKNSNGLPEEGHKMSARDIALLSSYIIEKFPKILEFESEKEFTYNDILQYNRNPLLGVFPGADGLKTGWTEEAGYCLAGTAVQNNMRMVSVVLNTQDEDERLEASQELLNYGFKNFELISVKSAGDIVDSIEIKKGKALEIPLKIDESIEVIVPILRKNDIKVVVLKDADYLNAPVEAGTSIGTLEVQMGDEVIAEASISTAEAVERAGFFELLIRAIANFFKTLFL